MMDNRRITICMATFNPDPELFHVQVESIRQQDDPDWTCVISDDCSDPERFRAIEDEIEGDPRFRVSRSETRLGFYRNFERALTMVGPDSGPVALSDQDDRWHPDKLTVLRKALGSAQLVYSDQRLVTEDGRVIAETYWSHRRNNFRNLTSLLVANTVTGAASLFRRDLLDLALPFPEVPGEQYHDHWLALVALSVGDINYVDRPLYDYVQHGNAVLGHAAANAGLQSLGWQRLDPRRAREIFGGWGSAYFDVYLRLQGLAELILVRAGDRLPARKKRVLTRFAAAPKSVVAVPWMALRPLRKLTGRNETLGSERVIARALLYRHLVAIRSRLPGKLGGNARRVRQGGKTGGSPTGLAEVDRMRQKIQPLSLGLNPGEPQRVNLLIPTIDLDHLFGGYIAKFNLARRLSEAGHRVRIVTVDPTYPPKGWQAKVEAYDGLDGLFEKVEVAFGREAGLLPVNPEDTFIATTWWTALIADELVPQTARSRFVYLIQEYEPLTVPPGSWAALAESSYRTSHFGVFSTGILQEYFRERKLGVFESDGSSDSISFRNAITPVDPPELADLEGRSTRRLLFYARPEAHAARNMFELGLLSLREAVASRVFGPEWEFHGIGSIGGGSSVELGGGTELKLRPRTDQHAYGSMLAGHDIGLALMYAPHPSLVPMEMASAGLCTVTNSYETKTAAALSAVSPNLITASPDPKSIAAALSRAVEMSGDFEARAAGARFDWPSDWNEAFGDEVIESISRFIHSA